MLGMVGLAGLIVVLVLYQAGKLHSGLPPPSGTGGLYAETFALWMLLFLTLSVAAALVPVTQIRFLLIGLASLFSLITLAWPVFWGVPWRQVREELGLTLGPRPLIEVLLGLGTYVTAIPLMVAGLLVTLLLMRLQSYLEGSNVPPPS